MCLGFRSLMHCSVTLPHVPERLFTRNNSIYWKGGGRWGIEIDWGSFCYPLTRAIRWAGEQDLVISPEINQCKRVQIPLPALPYGPSEQINFLSFIPVASSRGICLSENLHLSPDRLPLRKKMCGNEKKTKIKLLVRNCVLPGKPLRIWGKRSQRLSWCEKIENDLSLKKKEIKKKFQLPWHQN